MSETFCKCPTPYEGCRPADTPRFCERCKGLIADRLDAVPMFPKLQDAKTEQRLYRPRQFQNVYVDLDRYQGNSPSSTDELVEAAKEALVILGGLELAVQWELAPSIMKAIRELTPKLRKAIMGASQ
jgi:hypothetical protein